MTRAEAFASFALGNEIFSFQLFCQYKFLEPDVWQTFIIFEVLDKKNLPNIFFLSNSYFNMNSLY